jgi:carboxypeptidase C (cathepsin A)
MALQSSNTMLAGEAYAAIRSNAAAWKSQAQNANVTLAGTVNSDYIFQMLDQLGGASAALNTWKAVAGLDAYATAQGYTGTMSTDCASSVTSAQACIAWVVANFPAASGFLQSHVLNANGSRLPRSFTTAQTAGLQTALTSFIATIS